MSDYSAVAPPQNFSQSSAFAAALQRAKQIAAKINPTLAAESGTKRPLEEGSDSESKKVATEPTARPSSAAPSNSSGGSSGGGGNSSSAAAQAAAQAAAVAARVAAAAAAGIQGLGVPGIALGPVTNEDIKVPDKMVGLIIGRGGEQISRLQSESGCKIQMAPDSGGLPERVCTLTGNAQAISRAKELIGSIVQQRSRTEGGPGGGRMDDMGMGGNGGGGGGSGPQNMSHFNAYQVEIMVPGPKVGLIIGKGGETIKQLQEKSGAKMVVIQDGPSQENEKPLRISGDPQKVEHAKALVYELIAEKEIQRRDSESGRGRGNARGGGFDNRMGGGPGGRDFQDRGSSGRGWDSNGRTGGGDKAESTFTVPAAKCGVIIGRGGETIKQINQQTGAHCELDRRTPTNLAEKTFVIRGSPEQIEQARRLIAEKLGMVAGGPNPGGPSGPQNQYPGPMGGGPQQHYAPQGGWSGPAGYQQPWQNQPHPVDPNQGSQVQVNPQTGQPDYSAQWVEYYRSLGMHREADLIEQQAKASKQGLPQQPQQPAAGQGPAQQQPQGGAAQNGQPDYSAQWAEYYRSMGKVKEAEAIEASMKQKQQVAAVSAGGPASAQPGTGGPQPGTVNPYPQPQYGYQAGGFYAGAPGGPQPGQATPQAAAQQYAAYPNYAAYTAQPDNQ